APRAIGAIRALRDDAFKAERAGILENHRAVALNVLAVAQALRTATSHHRLEQILAIEKLGRTNVHAVEIEQVESNEDHLVRASGFERFDQLHETRHAGLVLDHGFAVDQR